MKKISLILLILLCKFGFSQNSIPEYRVIKNVTSFTKSLDLLNQIVPKKFTQADSIGFPIKYNCVSPIANDMYLLDTILARKERINLNSTVTPWYYNSKKNDTNFVFIKTYIPGDSIITLTMIKNFKVVNQEYLNSVMINSIKDMYKSNYNIVGSGTSNIVLTTKETIIDVNNLTLSSILNLPSCSLNIGKFVYIKRYNNLSTGSITINGNSGLTGIENLTGTFSSSTTLTTTPSSVGGRICLYATNTKWIRLQ